MFAQAFSLAVRVPSVFAHSRSIRDLPSSLSPGQVATEGAFAIFPPVSHPWDDRTSHANGRRYAHGQQFAY